MISFSFPGALLLLLLVPLFFVGAWMWLRRLAARLQRFSRHARVYLPFARVQLVLVAVGMMFGILALARPHWGEVSSPSERYTIEHRNVMLAIDISRSMLAQDVQPNRLEYVKADILEFLEKLEADRVGLIVFKGEAEMVCPLTSDLAFVKERVAKLDPLYLPAGETDLAKPIRLAMEAFEVAQSEHHLLLLISDGEALAGEALAAATEAGERSLPIFTIGVGNPKGTLLTIEGQPVYWQGEAVRTALDEATLKAIAERSGGRYLPLATSRLMKSSLETLYRHYLSQQAKSSSHVQAHLEKKDRTALFLCASVISFLAAAFLSLGRVSLARQKVRLMVGVLFVAVGSWAATPGREAQAAYEAGDYARAVELYTQALAADTGKEGEDQARLWYNKAIAAWKGGDFATALRSLEAIEADPTYRVRVAALQAHVMYEEVQAQRAAATDDHPLPPQENLNLQEGLVEAYTRALQLDPTQHVMKQNLARVRALLPELKAAVRRDEVSKRFEKEDLSALLQQSLSEQRVLIDTVPTITPKTKPAEAIAAAKAYADKVERLADGWYYLACCAQDKWQALLQAPETQTLSEAEQAQRQTALQMMQDTARQTYQTLDELVAMYRALETSPSALLPLEEVAYRMWQTLADVGALLEECLKMRESMVSGTLPLYYQQRPLRQEAQQMERRITTAVDQALQQPPPHLDEEKQKALAALNEQLKQWLQQPEDPAHDAAKIECLQQMQALLLPPPSQDQQQQQDQQNQQGQQDQQQAQQSSDAQSSQADEAQAQQQQAEQDNAQDANESQAEAPSQELSEEEKAAAMERARQEEEALKEALKHQELKAILEEAEMRAEQLEKEKRAYKAHKRASRTLKDW